MGVVTRVGLTGLVAQLRVSMSESTQGRCIKATPDYTSLKTPSSGRLLSPSRAARGALPIMPSHSSIPTARSLRAVVPLYRTRERSGCHTR